MNDSIQKTKKETKFYTIETFIEKGEEYQLYKPKYIGLDVYYSSEKKPAKWFLEIVEQERNEKEKKIRLIRIFEHEPVILKIGKNTYVKSASQAINSSILDGKKVILRSFGAESVNVSVKAIMMSNQQLKEANVELKCTPSYREIQGKTFIELRILVSQIKK